MAVNNKMKINIIGGGIMGLTSAWALTKLGHKVSLFEQGTIPNALGASGDHLRIIRRAYSAESGYAPMISEAFHAWDSLWKDLGVNAYDARGFVLLSREVDDEADIFRNGLDQGNFAYDVLSDEAIAQDLPFMRREGLRWAIKSDEGGILQCRLIAQALKTWLLKHGADLHENTQVANIDEPSATLTTQDGTTYDADHCLVTAGAWAKQFLPDLCRPLVAYRTASVYAEAPEIYQSAWQKAPVILDVGGEADGYIIPPSGAGGLKFGTGNHKIITDDANANRMADFGEGPQLLDWFNEALHQIDAYEIHDVVTCAYIFTEDERFYAAQSGRTWLLSACSGHGYKFGAAIGGRVAAALTLGDFDGLQTWLSAKPEKQPLKATMH